jgi:hypothetical protein
MEPALSLSTMLHPWLDTRRRTDPSAYACRRNQGGETPRSGQWVPPEGPYAAVMAMIVLRVRLVAGDRLDVTYEDPDVDDADEVAERVIAALADDSAIVRTNHGDRLVVLYGRGVAALEVAPRGAVL